MMTPKQKVLTSDISLKLYEELKNILNLDLWIVGLMFNLNDEQKQIILDMIYKGETNPNKLMDVALEFRGIVGTPIEEFEDNPEDILNWDDCTEEEKRIITENYQKRLEREAQNKN